MEILDLKAIRGAKFPKDKLKDNLPENQKGVYFLLLEDELVYIGKSKNFSKRILKHKYSNKEYNYISFFNVDFERLDVFEARHILIYLPIYNKRIDKIYL